MTAIKTVLLDGNIYDKLEPDLCTRERIVRLSESNAIRVIATPKVKDELKRESVPRNTRMVSGSFGEGVRF